MSGLLYGFGLGLACGLALVFVYWAAFSKYRKVLLDMKAALDVRPTFETVQSLIAARPATADADTSGASAGHAMMTATEARETYWRRQAEDAATAALRAAGDSKREDQDRLDHCVKMVASLEETTRTLTARVAELTAQVKSADEDVNGVYDHINKVVNRVVAVEAKADAASPLAKRLARVEGKLGHLKPSKRTADDAIGALATAQKANQDVAELRDRLNRALQQIGGAVDSINGRVNAVLAANRPAPAAPSTPLPIPANT